MQCVVVTVQTTNGEQHGEGAEGSAVSQGDGVRVHRSGFPRIIKAGHGVKLGAVVSPLYVPLVATPGHSTWSWGQTGESVVGTSSSYL